MKILTIAYGGILQMFCVGFTETYTMAVPLQVLRSLAADFDGYVIARRARKGQVCTPRNCWEVLKPNSLSLA